MYNLFRLCDPINASLSDDISNLYETLASNFAGIVQYNKDNRKFEGAKGTNITIDVACKVMENSGIGQPVSRYALLNSMLLDAYGQECLDYKYSKMIEEMRSTDWKSETSEGGKWTRTWWHSVMCRQMKYSCVLINIRIYNPL